MSDPDRYTCHRWGCQVPASRFFVWPMWYGPNGPAPINEWNFGEYCPEHGTWFLKQNEVDDGIDPHIQEVTEAELGLFKVMES